MGLITRIEHAWNAFNKKEEEVFLNTSNLGVSYNSPNYRATQTSYKASTFVGPIFNRIAMDASMVAIQHVKIDPKTEDRTMMKSGIQNCLDVEANIDQTYLQFIHDLVFSLFDEGTVAVVPIETEETPNKDGNMKDILTMRTAQIMQWYPQHVTVRLYNERTGMREDLTLPKNMVAIIENPLYSVINDSNSTLQRLIKKISQLDNIDALLASGQLDLLITLPYAVKTDLQKDAAKERIESIEDQLKGAKHGIAYIDETEKVTQLNRPVNDKALDEIKWLTQQFYNQIGLTEAVFNGTAGETEMRNYYSRTTEPIMKHITAEFRRKYLTKTARSQGQTFELYRDPFALVPIEQIAEIADKFRRNSVTTSNEMRGVIGMKRSNDPNADLLYNPNMPTQDQPDGAIVDDSGSPTSPDVIP